MAERDIEIGKLVRVTCGDTSPWSKKDTQTVSIVIGKRIQKDLRRGLPPYAILKVYCLYGTLWGVKHREASQHWFEVINGDR